MIDNLDEEVVVALIGVVLVVVVVVVAVIVVRVLAAVPEDSGRFPRVVRWVGLGVMLLVGGVTAVGVLEVTVSERVTVTVPITEMPVAQPEGVEFLIPPTATVVSGGFDRVTVDADGLGATARGLLGVGILIGGATIVGVTLVVTRLARSLGEGRPFLQGGRALRTTAIIVLVGGTLATAIGDLGESVASSDLFEVQAWSTAVVGDADADDTADAIVEAEDPLVEAGWPEPAPITVTFPFWPLAAGVALLLLGAAFQHGAELQNETEGLV